MAESIIEAPEYLGEAEYVTVNQQVHMFAELVRNMPLRAFLRTISRADRANPRYGPTAYRDNARKMRADEALGLALWDFQVEVEAIVERFKEGG